METRTKNSGDFFVLQILSSYSQKKVVVSLSLNRHKPDADGIQTDVLKTASTGCSLVWSLFQTTSVSAPTQPAKELKNCRCHVEETSE